MKIVNSAWRYRLISQIIVAVLGLSPALAALAHHSQSEFDPKQQVRIEGAVSRVEWKSPHARLYVDVTGPDGEKVQWNFELPSPNTLMRRGWNRHSLKPGDPVIVSGYRARNFPYIAIGRTVSDQNGKAIFAGEVDAATQ